MTAFRVGIDSYCLHPLEFSPFEVLEWTAAHGGEGVQFSEGLHAFGEAVDEGALHELADAARTSGLYLEWGGGQHVPFDTSTWSKKDLMAGNRSAAESANLVGARVVRSCSGGFFRWDDTSPDTDILLEAVAEALRPQRSLFEDFGVTLAIELHFEFTTFELLRLFEMCDAEPGGWLGICLDTFNMMPMLEDPVAGTGRVLPWIEATHIKDGAAVLGEDGLVTFPTELGTGQVDLPAILSLMGAAGREINLSVEDHGGVFTTQLSDPAFVARFPDASPKEMDKLLRIAGDDGISSDTAVSPTERNDWPRLCRERTEDDLRYLKSLVGDLSRNPENMADSY